MTPIQEYRKWLEERYKSKTANYGTEAGGEKHAYSQALEKLNTMFPEDTLSDHLDKIPGMEEESTEQVKAEMNNWGEMMRDID